MWRYREDKKRGSKKDEDIKRKDNESKRRSKKIMYIKRERGN